MGAAPMATIRCQWESATFYIKPHIPGMVHVIKVDVTSNTTIGHMKGMISEKIKLPAPTLRLIYGSRDLNDDTKTIGEICPFTSDLGTNICGLYFVYLRVNVLL